jgi:hypothetical protein
MGKADTERPEGASAAALPAEDPDRLVHQANNCVNGVKTALAVLRDAVAEGSEDERLLDLMDRDLDRLAELVRQLYDLTGGPGERR